MTSDSDFWSLRPDQRHAIRLAWHGWDTAPEVLAGVWKTYGTYDTLCAPNGAEDVLDHHPTPAGSLPSNNQALISDTDHNRLLVAVGMTPWRTWLTWHTHTADLIEAAPSSYQREHAGVKLMDSDALTDSRLAVWGIAEAARTALTAFECPTRVAKEWLDGIYNSSRPAPSTIRRAINAHVPTLTHAGRVYAA